MVPYVLAALPPTEITFGKTKRKGKQKEKRIGEKKAQVPLPGTCSRYCM